MKNVIIIIGVIIGMLVPSLVIAVERAPRISDREIIEGLADIRGDIKEIRANILRLEEGQKSLRSEMNSRFEAIDKRFDILQWMFGLFITVNLVILGFVLRMQWQMHRRQTRMETTLEVHKDDLAFLKGLIEKLLPPKGVL